MANRRERRRAAKVRVGDTILIEYGFLREDVPIYGQIHTCYVCSAPPRAHGSVCVRDKREDAYFLLCEACLSDRSSNTSNLVLRKYLGTPDLGISDGGPLTDETYRAMAEKLLGDEPEH
jgi:hypothetical protein